MFTETFIITFSAASIIAMFFLLKKYAGFSNSRIAWVLLARTLIVMTFIMLIAIQADYKIFSAMEFVGVSLLYAIIMIALEIIQKKYSKKNLIQNT